MSSLEKSCCLILGGIYLRKLFNLLSIENINDFKTCPEIRSCNRNGIRWLLSTSIFAKELKLNLQPCLTFEESRMLY